MEIKEVVKNDKIICKISGEVNIDTSPRLREMFDKIIQNSIKKVVIDTCGVSYIDSSGLATLIEMMQRLKKIDGEMRLCAMPEKVKSIFEVMKLDKLFTICDSEDEALNSL